MGDAGGKYGLATAPSVCAVFSGGLGKGFVFLRRFGSGKAIPFASTTRTTVATSGLPNSTARTY